MKSGTGAELISIWRRQLKVFLCARIPCISRQRHSVELSVSVRYGKNICQIDFRH